MCKYRYFSNGYRSFGSNIPGFALGAYFPGDEPGERCRLTGDFCDPEFCPELEENEKCEFDDCEQQGEDGDD